MTINKFAICILLCGLTTLTCAEPADEVGQVPQQSVPSTTQQSVPVIHQSVPHENLVTNSTGIVEEPAAVAEKPSNLALILASIALFFALLAVLSTFIFKRTNEKNIENGNKKMKVFSTELNKLRAEHSKEFTGFDAKLMSLIQKVQMLEEENQQLRHENQQLKSKSSQTSSDSALDSRQAHYLSEGQFNVLSLEKENIPETDDDVIDMISDFVKPILLQVQSDTNVEDFNDAFEKYGDNKRIKSFLTLKNTLSSASSRYFDALVVFLKEPLLSGANTLVYLRKDTAQHSKISFIFNNVPDGSKIEEVIIPAQLRQNSLSELELKDENIIKKGEVSLGGNK